MYRAIVACMVGSAFEWYDFALYGYFAALIGKLFFPSADPLVSLIGAFGVFAAGFAVRPLAAVMFGHIGDKYGRKKALVLSIFLMTLPTLLLGLLPTYDQIGVWAPILLVVLRICQGLSLGGNASGIFTFMIEYAPAHRRGLVGSLSITSAIVGILLGSGVVTFLSYSFSQADLELYGWRLPFIFGSLIGVAGFYLRKKIPETPRFQAELETSAESMPKYPVLGMLRYHWRSLVRSIIILIFNDVGFYVSFIYVATYLTTFANMPMDEAMLVNTLAMVIMLPTIPFMGWLSDRVGRKPLMQGACVVFFCGAIPVFYWLDSGDFWRVLGGQMVMAVGISMYFGTMATVLVEKFPTRYRYTGLALALNTSAAVFGGTAPLLVSYLTDITHIQHIPAYYLMAGALVSFIGLWGMKDRFKDPLD